MAAATALVSGGLAAYQTIDGISTRKKGERGIDNYERQDLQNAWENTQVSTMGSRYMAEESQRANANIIDATRNGGIRGVMGGISQIMGVNNMQNQEGRMYLDRQVQDRTNNIAQDDVRLREMRERRDENNIAGFSSQIQTGRQDMWSGMMGIAKAGRWGLQNGAFSKDAWSINGDNPANNKSVINVHATDRYNDNNLV
jgi:hypothetical protein